MSADLAYAAAFITARLDEDENYARSALSEVSDGTAIRVVDGELAIRPSAASGMLTTHIVRHRPAQALREVAAKRVIVAACTSAAEADPHGPAGVLALAVLDAMCLEWEHPDRPFVPDWTIRPGVLLRKALEAQGKSADDLLGGKRLLDGTLRIGPFEAENIGRLLGTSPETWLNAQRLYDAAILRGAADTSEEHEQ